MRVAGSGERTVVSRRSLQNAFSDCIFFGVGMIHEDGSMVMLFPYHCGGG